MVVSCFVFAWIGSRMRQARKNRDRVATCENEVKTAVAAIEELGGVVTSEYEERRLQTWLEKQFDDPGGADDPVGVLRVPAMNLRFCSVEDAALQHLKGLPKLERLYLSNKNVTDAGLKHVKSLTNLQILKLGGTNVTDDGLEYLSG